MKSHVSTVLVEHWGSRDAIAASRPSWRDRFVARWLPRRLDRALAAGTPPEAGAALALRAVRLTEPTERRSIADALRRVLCEAREPAHPSPARIVPNRSTVTSADQELSLLADTLAEPGPVAAQGVAEAHLLLTDGTGPLYNPRRDGLRSTAARAVRELRPWAAA